MRFIAPVQDDITQVWGENPGYYAQFGQKGHTGIDFACKSGTPIGASADGTVVFAGQEGASGAFTWIAGNVIQIDHGDVYTAYAHMSRFNVVKGQRVKQGDIIGYSGNTGVASGPHLHFEFLGKPTSWANGWSGRVNPYNYLVEEEGMEETTVVSSRSAAIKLLGLWGRNSHEVNDEDAIKSIMGKTLAQAVDTLKESDEGRNRQNAINNYDAVIRERDQARAQLGQKSAVVDKAAVLKYINEHMN